MKKITLTTFALFFISNAFAQILNQPASWPNTSWSVTGTYTASGVLFDPTLSSNFSYDDDIVGSGSASDEIQAESPVIDLTPTSDGGEIWITVTHDYDYNLGTSFSLEYYDVDSDQWVLWNDLPDNSSTTSNWCGTAVPNTSSILDISNFTPTQLLGFKYRFNFNGTGIWGWGFCTSSPTITSQMPPSCLSPTDLTASGMTNSTANLSWTANGSEEAWNIEFGSVGFVLGEGSLIPVNTNPYEITGLTTNSSYDYYVQADCGDGTSEWSGPFNFTTTPEPLIVDSGCMDFETGELGPNAGLTTNLYSNASVSAVAAATGSSFGVMLEGSDTAATFLTDVWSNTDHVSSINISVDATASEVVVLTFDLKQTYTFSSYYSTFRVTVNGVQIGSSIEAQTSSNDDFSFMNYDLSEYAGTTFNLKLEHVGKYSEAYSTAYPADAAYIDNICITAPSCVVPSDLAVSDISAEGATIAWTANNSETSWEYQVVESGATPSETGTVTSENPLVLSGLLSNTGYDFYLRAICSDGSFSEWASISFTTPPGCGDSLVYTPQNSTTYSVTVTATGDDIVYVTLSGNIETNYDSVVITDSTGNQLNEQIDGIFNEVQFISDGSVTVTFSNDGSVVNGDITILFTCGPPPACLVPSDLDTTAITAGGAAISWMSNNDGNTFEYQVVETGITPADSGSVTSENPLVLSGLMDNTTYDFYLRAICTDGSLSEWVSISFTTSPLPIVPDYLNDFSVFPGDLWTEGQGSPTNGPTGTTSSWLADGFGNNGFTGAARVNIYSTFPDEWLISPDFDLSAMTYYLNIDAAATEYASTLDAIWGDDDYAALFVSTDGGASWTEMYRWDRSNNPGAAGLAMPEIELTGYGVAKFAIYGESTVSNEDIDFFVDNFSITSSTLNTNDLEISQFTYFPNPVKDQLTIKAQNDVKDISVYNMLGQLVLRQVPNSLDCVVDMAAMQSGAYFVKVSIGNSVDTIRVLKK